MGRSQRTKGATYEREVAKELGDAFGFAVKREIGQARDGGADLILAPSGYPGKFYIECKRRKTLATIAEWLNQARRAAFQEGASGVVVMRADQGESMALMSLTLFKTLLDDHFTHCTRKREERE